MTFSTRLFLLLFLANVLQESGWPACSFRRSIPFVNNAPRVSHSQGASTFRESLQYAVNAGKRVIVLCEVIIIYLKHVSNLTRSHVPVVFFQNFPTGFRKVKTLKARHHSKVVTEFFQFVQRVIGSKGSDTSNQLLQLKDFISPFCALNVQRIEHYSQSLKTLLRLLLHPDPILVAHTFFHKRKESLYV